MVRHATLAGLLTVSLILPSCLCFSSSSPLCTSLPGGDLSSAPAVSSRPSTAACGATMAATPAGKLLVLGGTGFVGSEIVKQAVDKGFDVVAVSRRGGDSEAAKKALAGVKVDWRVGDVTKEEVVKEVLSEGGFTGMVHAVGILFETDMNKFASGSGSIPAPGTTYDLITRQTAQAAAGALAATKAPGGDPLPFAFVSAAEARWTFDGAFKGTPVEWLHRYLIAKRAVESDLVDNHGKAGALRPIIVRPSLVWTWSKPASFLPVGAFTVGNALGLPFVDRPVQVSTLAKSIVGAILDPKESGIFDFRGMERVAKAVGK